MTSILDGLFDLFDPQLKQLRQDNGTYNRQYNSLRSDIVNAHTTFVDVLNDYRGFVAYNTVLLISTSVLKMNDTQFKKYLKIADTPASNITAKQRLPENVVNNIAKGVGGRYMLNAIYKFHQIAADQSLSGAAQTLMGADAFSDALTAVGYSGLAIIPGVDMSNAPAVLVIANLGLEITAYIAAAGLDLVLMPYKINEEKSEYQTANSKLLTAINQLRSDIAEIQNATRQLQAKISEERHAFLNIMRKLNSIEAATFTWNLSPHHSDAEFKEAMSQAVMQYGIINILRNDWEHVHHNKPSITWDTFVSFEISKRDATHFTPNEVRAFANLVRQSSATMQNA